MRFCKRLYSEPLSLQQERYLYRESQIHRYISERLKLTGTDLLETVGNSYTRFRIEIANGLVRNQTGRYHSNGIAEALNNNTQTLIKVSYGYRDFKRFRKRCMLISRYKKTQI